MSYLVIFKEQLSEGEMAQTVDKVPEMSKEFKRMFNPLFVIECH